MTINNSLYALGESLFYAFILTVPTTGLLGYINNCIPDYFALYILFYQLCVFYQLSKLI